MKEGLVDSMVLMHYDNGHEKAIDWWERMLEDGWHLSISVVTLMERLKGIANLSGNRRMVISGFEARIDGMRKSSKIKRIYRVTAKISKVAYQLLREYCARYTPPSGGRSIEGLICDMLIAGTAIEHNLVLFTHNLRDFEWICNLRVQQPDYEVNA
ncbi:MAG: PIN domain-containing protein [Candidatus Bathyarchaeia archaeon]